MFKFIEDYVRHRTIKKYINKLGSYLKKKYGIKEYYTEEEINSFLGKYSLGKKHMAYAYALYMVPEHLDGVLIKINESKSAKIIKQHLAANYATDMMSNTFYTGGNYSSGDSDGGSD